MNKRSALMVTIAGALLLIARGSAGAAETTEQLPPARAIPGITAKDAFPQGCVDCHTVFPEMGMDQRLSTLMARWRGGVDAALLAKSQAAAPAGRTLSGKHPPLQASAFANVPASCLGCHGRSSTLAPPLGPLMHVVHLTDVGQSHFLTVYQGECTHCHKLNAQNGTWAIPSGSEQGSSGGT